MAATEGIAQLASMGMAKPQGRTRAGKQERKCPVCSQQFSKTEHLARHVRSHTKERPYSCQVCLRKYSRQYASRYYHASVADEKPSDTLLRHLRSHPGFSAQTRTPEGMQSGASANTSDLCGPTPGHEPSATSDPSQLNEHNYQNQQPPDTASSTLSGFATESSSSAVNDSFLRPPPDVQLWDTAFAGCDPLWLLGDDFDPNALNSSISATISEWGRPASTVPAHSALSDGLGISQLLADSINVSSAEDTLQKHWFTHLANDSASTAFSNPTANPENLDERYRADLSQRLQPRIYDTFLPSTEFLNLCIQLYFARFNPVFPIVHAPTFRPTSQNALLLLSVCSMGSLFVGSAKATAQGIKIFERLNKAVLASWETYMARDGTEALSLIQACLIGQTFGLLSGNPKDLIMVEAFHGTIISWARKLNLFRSRAAATVLDNLPEIHLDEAWKTWSQTEEKNRVVLGLYIHDAQLAGIFHHEPILRHCVGRLPHCASDELFSAPTASRWAMLMREKSASESAIERPFQSSPSQGSICRSPFYGYASLAEINASIYEARQLSSLDAAMVQHFHESLLSWYNKYQGSRVGRAPDSYCLMIFWHSTFMCLYINVDVLERAIGREGSAEAEASIPSVRAWTQSAEAQKCVRHALLIQKLIETMRLNTEPAIQVPYSLYLAGLVVHCYTRHSYDTQGFPPSDDDLNLPEFQVSNLARQHAFEVNGIYLGRYSMVDSSALCGIIDLLRRIGHWEIARKFADILEFLVNGVANATPVP